MACDRKILSAISLYIDTNIGFDVHQHDGVDEHGMTRTWIKHVVRLEFLPTYLGLANEKMKWVLCDVLAERRVHPLE